MGLQIVNITCPGCGARVQPNATLCEYCKGPIVITSFNSVAQMSLPLVNKYANAYKKNLLEAPDDQNLNTSIAMCYLKLRLYEENTYNNDSWPNGGYGDAGRLQKRIRHCDFGCQYRQWQGRQGVHR